MRHQSHHVGIEINLRMLTDLLLTAHQSHHVGIEMVFLPL